MNNRFMQVAAVVVAAVALTAAGCGSSSNKSSTAGSASSPSAATGSTSAAKSKAVKGSTINIGVDPGGQFKFQPTSLTVAAGKHKLVFTNNTAVKHDVIVGKGFSEDGQVGEVRKITNGTETTTLNLKPGDYTYYCDVPGHRQAGMTGTLTVK
jgi:plastocyanin